MIYGDAKAKTISLLNQKSNAGNLIASTDGNTLDFTLRMPALFDVTQKEIATTAKYIHKVKSISQNSIPNQLSTSLAPFDSVQHLSTDLVDAEALGALSYSFEVDNVATIYIEEENPVGTWTILSTINNTTPKGTFTKYTGFTNVVSPLHNVRLRFSGSYPYNIRNRALFAYLFPTISDIPDYERFIKYTMPTDYFKLQSIVNKDIDFPYIQSEPWYWEGRNVLSVDYRVKGSLDIFYFAYPADIPDNVADSYAFEIDEEAAQAMPFYVASQLLIDDPINKSVSAKLFDIYQGKLMNMQNIITQGSKSVKNSMFSSGRINSFNKF